jgi:hypothetical protein
MGAFKLVSRADVDRARRLIFEAEEPVAGHGEIGNGRSRVDNIRSDYGTSAEYLRRRLKRDAPALWEDVVSGVKSARAAAIEAGIVKVPTALDRLLKTWEKASDADRDAFLRRLGLAQENR